MKFTWGHGITIVFVLFMVYILSFVYRSYVNEVDLVAEDYYAQEIAYQDRIDNIANARHLEDKIQVHRTSEGVEIRFPEEEMIDTGSGTIQFFRPSDEELDIQVPLQLSESIQQLPIQLFHKGRYKVNISWKSNGQGMYITKDLVH
jgi:hypothetical protein